MEVLLFHGGLCAGSATKDFVNWKGYVLLPTCNILDLNQIERCPGWMCWHVVTISGLVVSLSCFLKHVVFQLGVSAPDKNYLRALFEKGASVVQHFQLAQHFSTSLLLLKSI